MIINCEAIDCAFNIDGECDTSKDVQLVDIDVRLQDGTIRRVIHCVTYKLDKRGK